MTLQEIRAEFSNKYNESEFQINKGASFLLLQGNHIVFTLSKTRNWDLKSNDTMYIEFSGIGGNFEVGETVYDCLRREVMEEIGINLSAVEFSEQTRIPVVSNCSDIKLIDIDVADDEPTPLYIVEMELPLRKDKPSNGKKYSCLQLFVYLAKIDEDASLTMNIEETIPALVFVKGSFLSTLLKGNVVCNSNGNEGITFFWNKKFETTLIPHSIHLIPKFTPKGLTLANLTFQDLKYSFKDM